MLTIQELMFNREVYLFLAKESDDKQLKKECLKVVKNIDKILEMVNGVAK